MEKLTKTDNETFVVRENFKGVRRVTTTSQTAFKILMSNLHGKVICASYVNKELDTTFQEYFTLDKSAVRGTLKLNYVVTDYLTYAKERNTEKVLDTLARTILTEYFETIDLSKAKFPFIMPKNIKKDFVNFINFHLSEMMPWIKVTSIGNVQVSNSKKVENRFGYKLNSFLNKKENEESYDVEYYDPAVAYKADDLMAKQYYPTKRYVAKDQMLYYCGSLRKPGSYSNNKAKGAIVNLGINVYSTNGKVVKGIENGELDNRLFVYPNVVFDVVNIRKFYSDTETVYRLFDELSDQISKALDYDTRIKNTVNDIVDVQTIDYKPIKQILETLRYQYGAKVRYILYPLKNPCVRKQAIVKNPDDVFKDFFNESKTRAARKADNKAIKL